MSYSEFVFNKSEGKVKGIVSHNIAKNLIKDLPDKYKKPYQFWNRIALISVAISIYLGFIFTWWVGLVSFFGISGVIFSSNKKSAAEHVLEYANENENYYNFLVSNKLMMVVEI
jgi:hypothetical protein